MKRKVGSIVLLIVFLSASTVLYAQEELRFGTVTLDDLSMTKYALDTSANAVVLTEAGEAYISNGDDYNLVFMHRVRIKILKKGGLAQANIEIPLYKHTSTRF